MAFWFVKWDITVGGLNVATVRVLRDGASSPARGARRRILKMSRVLVSELLIQRSGYHPSHIVSELLDFGESRIDRRAIGAKAASGHRSNAFIELFPCFFREHNLFLSILAHASFLSKWAKLPNH